MMKERALPVIDVCDLTREYANGAGSCTVLCGVSLTVRPGEMVAIMGPSGSGKSTLLSILGLLLAPTRGSYRMNGEDLLRLARSGQSSFRRHAVGFVFQKCNLVESATVYENLEFPLIYAGVRRKERPGRIREALARVNLLHRVDYLASLLSGGEQQRAAIARALVNHPGVVLADEPTGQLDRHNGQLVMEHFVRLAAEGETAVIIVTHDPEVAAFCHRTCVLEDGVLTETVRCP
ncbi:MAG: ABC transporter ATP-binding protein [Syntrophobacteraceae bacterium]|jgi:putative ABC transport system ATP-binding protein|nr:ABC transporter ATP-binding protein [Syntrophobacteraceae bacterium]